MLLVETVRKPGLDIRRYRRRWRRGASRGAVHDLGKILLDVALAVALSVDYLADVGVPRAESAVFGPVASDPTVSCPDRHARRQREARADSDPPGPRPSPRLGPARDAAPDKGGEVIVDLDGVLVIAHSDKQDPAATWKRTFGHHPIMGFVDHGAGDAGEPVSR
ncbi:transposase [Streptomyces sp. NPDC102274]|uniref:transposase n=1 Tax=Streptomyces sp. NPDC102274 TaxID=3366151 RepID=UPI003804D616